MDDSMISEYVEHNDAILLVVIPATQAPELSSSQALKIVKEFDAESTRTVGIISKIDQAASEPKALAAVQAPLLNQGPPKTSDIPWVALIGQSVSIASAQSSTGSENSLETAWRAESESLKYILTGAPQSKLGRVALVEALAGRIHSRMKLRLPNVLSGLQGKSQFVQDELVRLGEQMVNSAEGTRAIALQLCREFEDKFLLHITGGEGSGWKVVARFEGNFPNRIKQLPLDRHFDINNVKRIVLEADGYQPYLISAEKGLRSLIKGVLESAKEPSRLCVNEGHLFLVRGLLEALGPLLLKQVPLEAQINNHSQHLEVVCLVPPHLLVRQVNLHLVQVVLQLLGQPALQPLVLQAPQPSVLQALQSLVQQQLLHLAARGLHLACQMLLYLDLAEHLELQAALYLVPQAHLHSVPRALLHLVPQALLHLVLQLLQLLVPQRLHLVLQALLLLGLLLPCPLALGPLQFLVNQVVDKPAPVRISSLLTSRHLSQRRIRLPARKYHTKNDGPKERMMLLLNLIFVLKRL